MEKIYKLEDKNIKVKCQRCFTNKKFTVKEWNECPWQLADWKAETYFPFLPRFLTRWWFFRNNPNHLK